MRRAITVLSRSTQLTNHFTTTQKLPSSFLPTPSSLRTMSRYAAAHANFAGPGDSRPTAQQIIDDDSLRAPALADKVIVLTGASSGIGIETARALASTGARLFLGVRNVEKGQSACSDFLAPGRVELFKIDTSSLASVRSAAAEIRGKTNTLNVIINNAAIMACPEAKSEDGFELQFATNYLGHFLLYRLLEDLLLSSSTPAFHSRVVNVASSGHHAGGVRFDDLDFSSKPDAYNAWAAYGQSKTAMIYMTNQIERLHGAQGLHGLSLMPGGIMTGLQAHVPEETKKGWKKDEKVMAFMKSEAQGAATTVYAAVGKDWEGRGGKYLEDCDEAGPIPSPEARGVKGVAEHAYDEEKEVRLWKVASGLVGVA